HMSGVCLVWVANRSVRRAEMRPWLLGVTTGFQMVLLASSTIDTCFDVNSKKSCRSSPALQFSHFYCGKQTVDAVRRQTLMWKVQSKSMQVPHVRVNGTVQSWSLLA